MAEKIIWVNTNNTLAIIVTFILPFIVFFIVSLSFVAYNFAFWHPIILIAYFAAIYFTLLKDFNIKKLAIYFGLATVFMVLFFSFML